MPPVWTPPKTWSPGELVTAALLNQHLRDNLDWVKTPPWVQQYNPGSGNYTLSTLTAWSLFHADFNKQLTTRGGRVLVYFGAMVTFNNPGHSMFTVEVNGVIQGGGDGLAALVNATTGFVTFTLPLVLAEVTHTFRLMNRTNQTAASTTTIHNHPASISERYAPIFWIGEIA